MTAFAVTALLALSVAYAADQPEQAIAQAEPAAPATEVKPLDVKATGQREWNYFKGQAETTDKEMMTTLLNELDAWLITYADEDTGDDALLLKADLQTRLGDTKGAIVTFMRHVYEYPNSDLSFTLISKLSRMIDKNISSKLKPALEKVRQGSKKTTKAERMADFLIQMSDGALDYFYEPMIQEFEAFFSKYPEYGRTDEVVLALGKFNASHAFYQSAVFQFNEIAAVYPDSPLKAQAKVLAASVYENNLRQYDKAMALFQSIVNDFPNSDAARASYVRIAQLAEKQSQYTLAVEAYRTLITKYPNTEDAYTAFINEAELLRQKMEDPTGAVTVLAQAADMFKGNADKSVKALTLAASIAAKDKKDYELQIKMLDRLVAEYPDAEPSPQALFDSASISAEYLKDPDRAALKYQQLIDRYPGNSLVKKAEKAIKKLSSN